MAIVLLVDDDNLVRQSLAIALETAGHTVVNAASGSEGLRIWQNHPVDIIVTDIFMPEGEGIELITRLRQDGCMLPIVAMTGGYAGALNLTRDDGPLYLKAAGLLGATRTLSKPFTPATLYAVIDDCLCESGDRAAKA